MTIGERIKQRRILLNLSQDELAKKVGYKSRSSIQKIEASRNLPLSKVSLMARALECPEAVLMGWEDYIYEDGMIKTPDTEDKSDTDTDIEKAMELYSQFVSLSPENQTALLTLLASLQNEV